MNTGTRLRTVLAIATSINTALLATDLTGFNNPTVDLIYKIVSLVLNFIIVAIVTYYNNDYTDIASDYTAEMRQKKLEQMDGYVGERFYDDMYPEEEDEDEE